MNTEFFMNFNLPPLPHTLKPSPQENIQNTREQNLQSTSLQEIIPNLKFSQVYQRERCRVMSQS